MKIKKFLLILFMATFMISKTSYADVVQLTNTYKQGVYDVSKFEGYQGIAELLTPGKTVTIMLLDSTGKLITYATLKSKDEVVILPSPEKGYKLIVVGDGEVVIGSKKI